MQLTTSFKQDKYTDYIIQSFDLQVTNNQYINELPKVNLNDLTTFNWQVGLIVGNSGSGKSTLLRSIGQYTSPISDNNKPIISQFPRLTPSDAAELLLGVGLCSIPKYLQTPNTLSTGERARFDIAMSLYQAMFAENHIALIDEFTSTVNRLCAKAIANSLHHYLLKHNDIKVVFASCHFDMIEELCPDWVVNLNIINTNNESEISRVTYVNKLNNAINSDSILSSVYEIL